MAHIPDDQLDCLKQEVSLQRLAEGVGWSSSATGPI